MGINVAKEVATLRHMTVSELRDRYHEVFGEDTNARNKQWLIKRIAWKLQANAEGYISERARRLAHQIAMETDIRTSLSRVTRRRPQKRWRRQRRRFRRLPTIGFHCLVPTWSRHTKGAVSKSWCDQIHSSSRGLNTRHSQLSVESSQGKRTSTDFTSSDYAKRRLLNE